MPSAQQAPAANLRAGLPFAKQGHGGAARQRQQTPRLSILNHHGHGGHAFGQRPCRKPLAVDKIQPRIGTPQRLRGLQRVGGNALAQLLQGIAQHAGIQYRVRLQQLHIASSQRTQRCAAGVEVQAAAVARALHPCGLKAAPALRIVQQQRHAPTLQALQPDMALQQAAFALNQTYAGHTPLVVHGLALRLHFGLVQRPAQRGHHIGFDIGRHGIASFHRIHQQLPVTQLHQQITRPLRVAVHQLPGFLDAGRHAGGLRIDHARRHGLPVQACLAVARLVGQTGSHHVLHPQRQLLHAGSHLVPALVVTPGLLPGQYLGVGRRCHCNGCRLGLFFPGFFLAASQPGIDPLGRLAAFGHLACCAQQHQRQAVLAGELAAGAGAFEGRATQVDLGLIRLGAAALTVAPEGLSIAAEQWPLCQ